MTGHDPDDELSAALQKLPREMAPPPHVAEALSAMNRRNRRAPTIWRLAVAASLVAVAFAAGRLSAPNRGDAGPPDVSAPSAPSAAEFAFLLYGGAPSGSGDDRAREYGAWAMELRRRGTTVTGERLGDESWMTGAPKADGSAVRGFFIVRARDSAEAVELARRHPHTREGTIEVRPIDTP